MTQVRLKSRKKKDSKAARAMELIQVKKNFFPAKHEKNQKTFFLKNHYKYWFLNTIH